MTTSLRRSGGSLDPTCEGFHVVVPSTSRFPFLAAVALLAAAIGDPLVETISNTGVFGHGYDDNNHLSVIPTFVACALLALFVIASRCRDAIRRIDRTQAGDWLATGAAVVAGRSPLLDVPAVIALQLAALFAMESVEQVALGGKLAGGLAWLGGPIVFSVLTHALIGTACTLLCAFSLRSLVRSIASLVREALDVILCLISREDERFFLRRREGKSLLRVRAPQTSRLRGRAPPRSLRAAS